MVNLYRMDLLTPPWIFATVGAACLVLVPLGAIPAWWTARSRDPARAVRVITTE
jgi:hypothetical protein